MFVRRFALLVLTGVLLLSFQTPAGAQSNSGLKGTVIDKDGAPLPAARVVVTNPNLGVTEGLVTDANGQFRIVPLPSGSGYTVEVSFPEMATTVQSDISLNPNKILVINITLRPSSELRETVRVLGVTEVVQTDKASTETTLDSEFIDSLPILGRNYQDVLTLAPGVSDVDGDGNPNIHGARDTDVITLVDGVSTTDPLTGQRGAELNIESIQEIEVVTSGASAEFSRGQGGFVNIVTKSGGNDFEGSFKFFWQSDIFDGDGAGIDDARLHGGLSEHGLRDLKFDNLTPFLSLSGPIVRDKAWYFVTGEYIQIEEPVNALTQAFVRSQTERRLFGKVTWDMSTNHKLKFQANYDPQRFENQGVNSFVALESGFTLEAGGTVLLLTETSILSPNLFLETTVAQLNTEPIRVPTTDPDTNGNGILFFDRDGDRFIDAKERDTGEDWDNDLAFDVYEDIDGDGQLDETRDANGQILYTEDRDGDGRLTFGSADGQLNGACEGTFREDIDCDGNLDRLNEDETWCGFVGDPRCNNGVLDVGEDIDNDGRLDAGIEDRNLNSQLDDRPFPGSQGDSRRPDENGVLTYYYPYQRLTPTVQDRDLTFDNRTLRTYGPNSLDFSSERSRTTLREDLTLFVPDWHGTHDMKMGAKLELEEYQQDTFQRPFVLDNLSPPTVSAFQPSKGVILPAENNVYNEAESTTFGVYVTDTYKPLPNLTLNVGVRFDREATDSFGYTPFDPAEERATYDRLRFLLGAEDGKVDRTEGNNDGFMSRGICSDPIFLGLPSGNACDFDASNSGAPYAPLIAEMQRVSTVAGSRLTQHHVQTTIVATELSTLYPDAIITDPDTGEEIIDRDLLRTRGVATFQEREAFRLTNNNLAPRLSLSWDPWADSKTRFFASWGRFYDKLFLGSVIPEEGPDTIVRYYRKDQDGVSGAGVPNGGFGRPISKAPPSATQVDRGLQTPYSDEFSIGFERELAPEVSLRVSYITRKGRHGLQDRDINHEVRYDDDGQMLDIQGVLISGGGQGSGQSTRASDNYPDLFIHNYFFNQIYRLGNYNESRYKGIEVQLTKRLSRKWQMDASYTYSRALGDAEDFTSVLGDDPATADYEYGPLNFDQRHVARLNAVTFLPGDWQLGGAFSWTSGLPYTTRSQFFSLDDFDYGQQRQIFGRIIRGDKGAVFVGEQRNSQRNDDIYNIDVKATKSLVIGRFNSKIHLEIQNLLNSDDLNITFFDPSSTNRSGNLQLQSTRGFGRRFQVGFQFEF